MSAYIVRTTEMGTWDHTFKPREDAVREYRNVEAQIGNYPYLEGVDLYEIQEDGSLKQLQP